ncbi:MAG: Holliday junction resolvase RuvX [Gammaproteobacteria bacterium]|nr:Holliday junction resolvase RuvX [Gammaproteobacteria bacterium]MDH3369704.1 Holliday junction resolvase RuvX [Gammaproteobacteria bacterium]MDH3405676.1 Holliday junction resolvase RuvX [Gammaproteobacteria bacterium]MDH3562070.1 Holliday junction resolvase RuvX [Gammaproteobacteria bacterium]MDH5486243.1 Holliday junction resolvase RuvX [Gammaproteobacteria bacterium]
MKNRSFLAFDYGEKYIGVAVGSSHRRVAEPVTTLRGSAKNPDWSGVSRLIDEWHPDALIVGLPLNMDGSDNPMTRAARAFGLRLKERYNLPVHMVDERLSTLAARDILNEAGVPMRRHKSRLDKLAAQTILQAFLNELPGASP